MPEIANEAWPELLDRAIGSPSPGGAGTEALLVAGRRAVRRRQVAASAATALTVAAIVVLTIALHPGGGHQTGAPYASDPTVTATPTPTPPVTASSNGSPVPPIVTEQASDQVTVGAAYVTWGPDGLVGKDGTTILAQRSPVELKDFAPPGVRTAAAKVRTYDGTIWYVVAREDADPQFINVIGASRWSTLAEFVAWAKDRYRSGEGLL